MRVSRPESPSATTPTYSAVPNVTAVHHQYTAQATKRNAVRSPKILYSVFIDEPSGSRAGGALVRERRGLDRGGALPDRGQRLSRRLPRRLRGKELGVLRRGPRTSLEVHHRVVDATQLRAAPDIRALGQDRGLELVDHVTGEHVALEQHLRHPERVDDVGGVLLEQDRLVGGHHQDRNVGVGADGVDRLTVRPQGTRVRELPVPLEGVDADGHVGVRRDSVDVRLDDGGVVEEHRDDEHRRDRVDQLDRQVEPRLHGQFLLAPSAVAHHAPEDQAPDEYAYGEGGDDRPDPEVEHPGALWGHPTLRPAEREGLVDRASAQQGDE